MFSTFPILLMLGTVTENMALFFELKQHMNECFKTMPSVGHRLVGSYEADGPTEGVVATISNTGVDRKHVRSKTVWKSTESSAKFDVEVDDGGVHVLCFTSTIADIQMVSFNIHVDVHGGHDVLDASHKEFVTKEHTAQVTDLVGQLESRVAEILDQQQYAITREAVHRDTAESANSRVMWWTLVEVVVLIALATFQVSYLKSYFEVKQVV